MIQGVRNNQLLGYGLVVGLDGSGDKVSSSPFTQQSLRSMLTQLGIVVPPGIELNPKNVAAVTVHADLPPFSKPGQQIDVTVSSIGDAKSLRGGSLLMTPLKGIDGQVYAIAQGNLVVGGLAAEGADGSKVTINIPSSGRVPNGATVERSVATPFGQDAMLTLNLKEGDFTTVQRVTDAINKAMGEGAAFRDRCHLGKGQCAEGHRSARRFRVDDREPRGRSRRGGGAGHRQLAHRYRGDQQHGAGQPGRGVAWQPGRDDQ